MLSFLSARTSDIVSMKWHNTKQAAQLLKVSEGRVRQLVVKFRNDSALVAQKNGRNFVSDAFIDKHYKSARASANFSANSNKDLLDQLEEGLHISNDGKFIQVFNADKYDSFKNQLIEARQLALMLAQEKEQTEFLKRQLDKRDETLSNALGLIEQSLYSIEEKLQERKREQVLEWGKIKKDK